MLILVKCAGKTELAKQIANYIHKDKKEVRSIRKYFRLKLICFLSIGLYKTGHVRVSRKARGMSCSNSL